MTNYIRYFINKAGQILGTSICIARRVTTLGSLWLIQQRTANQSSQMLADQFQVLICYN